LPNKHSKRLGICSPVGFVIKNFLCYNYQHQICTVFTKLLPEEVTPLTPGNIIMIGNLKLIVERFNTTAVAKIGNRTKMEDTYIMAHDLGID
jgi:hypothetical protein